MERVRSGPRDAFEKGQLVQIKDDVDDGELGSLQKETVYKVLGIVRVGGGLDGAWVGPIDMSDSDVNDFDQRHLIGTPPDPRYARVHPVLLSQLRLARL